MKNRIKSVFQYAGVLLLLPILVNGSFSILKWAVRSKAKVLVYEDDQGDGVDGRFFVAVIFGFILWFWLIYKIRRADMSDEEKRRSEVAATRNDTEPL